MKRKFVCLTLAAASFMALAACTKTPDGDSKASSSAASSSSSAAEKKVVSVTINKTTTTVNVAESITLDASVVVENGASTLVTWSIESGEDCAEIGSSTGKLVGKKEGTVTVKATSVADATKTDTVEITVVSNFDKIADFTEAGEYFVCGVVVAVNAKGFLINDGTGTTLVYQNAVPTVKVGDYVTVKETVKGGDYNPSNGLWEFTKSAVVNVLDISAPSVDTSATPLTKDVADGWKDITAVDPATHVKKYSWNADCGVSGGFFTLNFAESDTLIEPFYPQSDIVFEEGHNYDLEGYFVGYSTKYTYASIFFTKVEDTSKVSVKADKTQLEKGETAQMTATSKDAEDTITFTSSNDKVATVSADTGLVTAVGFGSAVITAKGSHSNEEATVTIIVTDATLEKVELTSADSLDATNEYFECTNCSANTRYSQVTMAKTSSSIKTKDTISNIYCVVIDIYGSYVNQKVYAGTSASGTALSYTKGTGKGTTYTYYLDGADSCYISNTSNYSISIYSIAVYYTVAE